MRSERLGPEGGGDGSGEDRVDEPWAVGNESPTPAPTVERLDPKPANRSVLSRVRGRLGAVINTGRSGIPQAFRRGGALVLRGRDAIVARPTRAASLVAALAVVSAAIPLATLRSKGAPPETAPSVEAVEPAAPKSTTTTPKPYQPAPALSGLDLKSIAVDDAGVVATAANGRVARLTLDPRMQVSATRILKKHKLPQVAAVMMEPSTGKILAYASQGGDGRDLVVDASAPSASVFKVVTGAALVQIAGVSADLKVCYSGGEQKILPSDLKEDPKKDAYCATVAQAMGRSINTIFARLAAKKLNGPDLAAIAAQLGYGSPIPFDVPVAVSKIDLPTDTLNFARTAAGFWNTTLSPLHGALLAATIANGGVTMRPYVVSEVLDGTTSIYKASGSTTLRKAIEPATASTLEKMMLETVSQGTSYKAFHDAKGKAFLPGIEVAGKTGTLNQPSPLKMYTWFVGYAPAKKPTVAIATLVVNDPVWKVKANVVARELLQSWFAQQGASGVTPPPLD
jgi:peptidoglycan glycosyltransferase